MKITMQLTVTDLIRTLRWQAMELAEDAAEKSSKVRKQPAPQRDDQS